MHNVSTMFASSAVRPNSGCGSSAPSSSGNCQSQKGDFNAALRSAMSAYSSKDCQSSKDCKPSKEDESKTEEPQEETNVSTETPPVAEAPPPQENPNATPPSQPSQPGHHNPPGPPKTISLVERQIVFHRVMVPVRAQVVHVVPIHHQAPYRLIVPHHGYNFHHGPQRFGRNDPELDSYAMQLAKEMGIGGGRDSRNALKKFFDALQELLDKGMISRNDVIDTVKHPQKMHRFRGSHHVEFVSASELFERLWGKEAKAGKGEKGEKSEKAENAA
jgi:hypothetical protein